MEATNWQRPVGADGNLDVRVGDVWEFESEGKREIASPVRMRSSDGKLEVCYFSWDGYHPRMVDDLLTLVSRNDTPWTVPEDKRKGRWVHTKDMSNDELGRFMQQPGGEYRYGMAWLPDAPAAPEAVRMDAPTDEQIDTFLNCVRLELMHALDEFPDPAGSMAALTEEVGEVAKALLDEPQEDVHTECVQTAVVALRVAVQGDPSLDPIRLAKGLNKSSVNKDGE